MTSYSTLPRTFDRAQTYLYFKEKINQLFTPENTRNHNNTVRALLLASLNNGYVESSSETLKLCGQTVRNHIKHQNPQRVLEVNQAVIQEMKNKGALAKPLILAVDWHDVMYYGDSTAEGVVGAMPQNGSCYAYRFATASVLLNGQRVTLAVVPMLDRCALPHVESLLATVFQLGLSVKLLLFDRGYYSTALIRYLDERGLKYIIHIPWHGKRLQAGIDRLHTTTTHKRKQVEQATFRLVTVRQKDKLLVFATNTSFRRRWVRRVFRRRWGIETSYRLIGMFLAKTTSKLYRLRVLYFFLAVLLYNLWVCRNFRRKLTVSVYVLKHGLRLFLVFSWLTDLEEGG